MQGDGAQRGKSGGVGIRVCFCSVSTAQQLRGDLGTGIQVCDKESRHGSPLSLSACPA